MLTMAKRSVGPAMRGLLLAFASLQTLSTATASPAQERVIQGSARHTLADILDRIDWDPARQGALLIVAPDKALQAPPVQGQAVELKDPGPQGYRLTVIDGIFGRKVMPLATLTAVTPLTMTVLNQDFPPPDPYQDLSLDEVQRLFLASLSPALWKKLGSPQGLGANDLGRDQRALFLRILPDPMTLQRRIPDGGPNGLGFVDTVPITPQQRALVRLSARRVLDWSLDSVERPGAYLWNGGSDNPPRGGTEPLLEIYPAYNQEVRRQREGMLLGWPAKQEVPNRLKPSDLNYAANALTGRTVLLAGVKTVGELVARIAQVTGLELYTDVRYRDLSVFVRGERAGAGDLLQALALSVTGAFRRLPDAATGGSVYVLTDDPEGLGRRHVRIAAYARTLLTAIEQREEEVDRRLREARPIEHLEFASNDPYRPSATLSQRVDEFLRGAPQPTRTPGRTGDLFVPVGDLPPAAQERVKEQIRKQIERNDKETNSVSRFTPRTDAVRLDARLRLFCVLPDGSTAVLKQNVYTSNDWRSLSRGMGAPQPVGGGVSGAEKTPLPLALPKTLSKRVLYVAPTGPEEAAKAAIAARQAGLTHLGMSLAPNTTAMQVAEMAAAAKKAAPGLGIWAVTSVLRAIEKETVFGPESRDVNLMGETYTASIVRRTAEGLGPIPGLPAGTTGRAWLEAKQVQGDFLRPDLPAIQERVTKRLRSLVGVPELDGLILRDLTPPGYTPKAGTARLFDAAVLGEFEEEVGVVVLPELPLGVGRL